MIDYIQEKPFVKGQCQHTQIYKQHYSSQNMNNRVLYRGQKIDL